MQKPDLLSSLPGDIHPLYMAYLSSHNLAQLSLVSQRLKAMVRQRAVWKPKFLKHFPDLAPAEEPNDWYALFSTTSLDQYPDAKKRHLFYNGKDGFLWTVEDALKPKMTVFGIQQPGLLYDLVQTEDKNFLTPIDWIIRFNYQFFLDAIFTQALMSFTKTDKTLNYEKQDKLGWSVAHWAVITNQDEAKIVEYISEIRKKDLFEKLFKTITPLHIAAEFGVSRLVKLLIQHFNPPYLKIFNKKKTKLGPVESDEATFKLSMSALHLAAAKGHLSAVEALLDGKTDLNQPGYEEEIKKELVTINKSAKAIHWSSENGHLSVVKFLLQRDACAFEEDDWHNSPLTYSVRRNQKPLFDLLIQQEKGETIDISASLNRALFDAVFRQYVEYIQPLVRKGADPTWKHTFSDFRCSGRSAIDVAMASENGQIVKLLLGELKESKPNSYKPANYKGICSFIFLLPSLFCIGLPGFVLCLYTGKDLPYSLGLIFGLIALFIVGFGLGPVIGFMIGTILELRAQERAQIFSRTLTTDSGDLEMAITQSHYPQLAVRELTESEEEALPILRRVRPTPTADPIAPYVGQTFLSPPSPQVAKLSSQDAPPAANIPR